MLPLNFSRLVIFCLFFLFSLMPWPGLGFAADQEAVLVRVQGTVLVRILEGGEWMAGQKWMKIPLTGRVKTLPSASADILIDGKVLIRIKEKTELEINVVQKEILRVVSKAGLKGETGKGTLLKLFGGKALLLVAPGFRGLPLVIDTPIGMAGVTGTRFIIDLTASDRCYLAVWEGKVLFWNRAQPEQSVLVGPGTISRVSFTGPPTGPARMKPSEKRRYQEMEELHFWPKTGGRTREPGSRYNGKFSRGYSVTTYDTFYMTTYEGSMMSSDTGCMTGNTMSSDTSCMTGSGSNTMSHGSGASNEPSMSMPASQMSGNPMPAVSTQKPASGTHTSTMLGECGKKK
jgi:hypothetical protein